MYRRISVHLDQGFDCKRRTQAAIGLAKRHQAELVGIYATSAPPQYYYGESVLMSRALNVMKDLQAQGRDSVQNAFLAAASQADIPAQLRSDDTSPSASVALHGRVSDLIIVSQLNRDDVEAAHENEFVEQTLLTAGRPVLVVPSSGHFPVIGERVLYCWDGSRESARALADAAPVLRMADHLVVLTMDEGAATRAPDRPASTTWPATARPRACPGRARAPRHQGRGRRQHHPQRGGRLQRRPDRHGRLRSQQAQEWAMGGATASILKTMTVPIMFSH